MIEVTIDARKALRDLKAFREKAVPYAIRNALNRAAFHARGEWQAEVRGAFTLRNKYTERSIQVERATGKDTRGMVAKVGSVADYMDEQETGATVRGRSKHKPIPAPTAAGLQPGGKRTRLVRPGNKLAALQVLKPVGKTPRQRNAVALAMARRKGRKVALLERPRGGKGFFLLGRGKRKVSTRLLWDLSRGSVRVKPSPTLQRTLARVEPRLADIHRDAVVEQLRRHKILGY